MIVGLGIDMLEVERLRVSSGGMEFLRRLLHPDEFSYIENSGEDPFVLAAARFCAKEAFGKALGTGLRGLKLSEMCIVHDKRRKPQMMLFGQAESAFSRAGGKTLHVSLTHEQKYAAAVVVIES